jgi:glycosyltransferase involved in cell wall biosynthesis
MSKIILITPFPNKDNIHANNSGIVSYSHFLASELVKKTNVEVWANISKDLEEHEEISSENTLCVKRVWSKNLSGIFKIIKKIWKDRPTVIHVEQELSMFDSVITFPLSVLIFIIPRILGIKVVTTMHGGFGIKQIDKTFVQENGYNLPPFTIKLAFYFSFGLIAHSSSKIIVHEEWQKEELREDYKVSKNKIFVISHGVPGVVEILNTKIEREKLNIGKDTKVFLYMGFAAKYKGLPEMFEIYKEHIKFNPNSLLIVGAGVASRLQSDENYVNWYELLRMKYESLGKNVRWIGFIPSVEVSRYYSVADVVVFPYSRRLAASGPMAIAIGYEKDIVLSSILKGDKVFTFDFNDIQKTKELKDDRTWAKVAEKTLDVYNS